MLLVMGLFAGCGGSDEETASNGESREVTVLAAASLTDALDEIIQEYNKDCDDTITTSYAGSGDLVQQIKGGAPCDLFISASSSNMDDLEEEGLIDTDSRKDLLGNTLTLIATAEAADRGKHGRADNRRGDADCHWRAGDGTCGKLRHTGI